MKVVIVKISVEGKPRTILFIGTENRLELFFQTNSVARLLAKSRLIIEEISEEQARKDARTMREFSTHKLTERGERPWST